MNQRLSDLPFTPHRTWVNTQGTFYIFKPDELRARDLNMLHVARAHFERTPVMTIEDINAMIAATDEVTP